MLKASPNYARVPMSREQKLLMVCFCMFSFAREPIAGWIAWSVAGNKEAPVVAAFASRLCSSADASSLPKSAYLWCSSEATCKSWGLV